MAGIIKKYAGLLSAVLAAALLGLLLGFIVFGEDEESAVGWRKVFTALALALAGGIGWMKFGKKGGKKVKESKLSIQSDMSLGGSREKDESGNMKSEFKIGWKLQISRGVKSKTSIPREMFSLPSYRERAQAGNMDEQFPFDFPASRGESQAGNMNEQFQLGLAFYFGSGVEMDKKEAAKCFRLAAEQEYADARANLGVMYHKGEGVSQDDSEAAKWWSRAAEQWHAEAQYNLGVAYHKGVGVPQDDNEAVKWWRCAAGQGDADAKAALEQLREGGGRKE